MAGIVEMFFNEAFLISLTAAGIRMATPLLLAALGELIAERAGILNLSLEGIMTAGAFASYAMTFFTGNLWDGLVFAMIAGVIFGLLMAYASVTLRANQVIVGLGLWLLGLGAVHFLFRATFGVLTIPYTIPRLEPIPIPTLSQIPIIGKILFEQNLLVYMAFILVPIVYIILFKTTLGLKIRSVGENPRAADTLGINIFLLRYVCTIIGAALTGLGGAYLALELGFFREYMVSGRGWITIALVIFSGWEPFKALAGSILFGLIDALQIRVQALQIPIPYQILQMLPFIATFIALIIISKKVVGKPAALSIPYRREEE
ncbi:MAG: ABC transporter permease [Candidatus Bathyarchaeia archaeon]